MHEYNVYYSALPCIAFCSSTRFAFVRNCIASSTSKQKDILKLSQLAFTTQS